MTIVYPACSSPHSKGHHEAAVHVHLAFSRDLMDVDAPPDAPVKLGAEIDCRSLFLCDEHDPGEGLRDELIPEDWDLLEDASERLPE